MDEKKSNRFNQDFFDLAFFGDRLILVAQHRAD